MIVTKESALQMWCPFVRHSSSDSPTFNRGSENNNPTNTDVGYTPTSNQYFGCHCIADKCMAWHYVGKSEGYCGLAGQP